MSSIVNSVILQYLKEQHPAVATIFQKEGKVATHQHPPDGITLESLILHNLTGKKHNASRLSPEREGPTKKNRRTEAKAPLSDSSSDDDGEPVKKPVAKAKASPAVRPVAKKAPLPDSSSDDGEPVKKPVAKAKASPAVRPVAKKAPLPDSSSDDDGEPVKKPVAKAKASPAMRPVTKKAPLPDSSSDDDGEPVKKPVAKAKASPAMRPVAKKAPLPDSSSDDDGEPVKKPVAKAKASPAMRPVTKKAPLPDSSSDDDGEPVKKPVEKRPLLSERSDDEPLRKKVCSEGGSHEQLSLGNGSQDCRGRRNDIRNGNGGVKRFERIDPTKVVFLKEELKDNRPGSEHMVLRQNQEMMRVKGKNFNKLKQKNKGKFYAAGVDTTVRAFQFDDSD